MTTREQFIRGGLAVLFVLLALRLGGFVHGFGSQSLQMDFAAYYTAAESVELGLSPYENHVTHDPPVWDGRGFFRHSRFLYPPLVAYLFVPLAKLPYHTAKWIWMLAGLGCTLASLIVAFRALNLEMRVDRLLLVGCFTMAFHPLLTYLERGQIDGPSLLAYTGATALLAGRRRPLLAGLLLALATLLKLHVAFIVPFLIWRRHFKVLAGYALGCALLVLANLGIAGYDATARYVTEELPRISRFGEGGTPQMRLPPEATARILRGVPEGLKPKDGRLYKDAYFSFAGVPTAVHRVQQAIHGIAGFKPRRSLTSLALLAVVCSILWAWARWRQVPWNLPPQAEFAYWQLAAVVILFTGPITWVMNLIWLLPVLVLVLKVFGEIRPVPLICCVAGLVLAALPDALAFPMLFPFGGDWFNEKYVIGEGLMIVGLAGIISQIASCREPSATSPLVPVDR